MRTRVVRAVQALPLDGDSEKFPMIS